MEERRNAGKRLAESALGEGLSREDIDQLAALGAIETAEPGDRLIQQGDPADSLLLLLSGAADVVRADESGKERIIGSTRAGDTVGELGLLLDSKRLASVRATEPTRYLRLGRAEFRGQLEHGNPGARKLLESLATVLAHRFRATADALETAEHGAKSRVRVDLSDLKDRYRRSFSHLV